MNRNMKERGKEVNRENFKGFLPSCLPALSLLFILILGTWLRLIFIDKPDGLWNDEYVSWYVASIPYGKAFWHAVFAQCHMPFYYFYLKFFMHFYGESDLLLRLTSILPGILSIVSMFMVGRELKDNNAGILCAAITSFSSFLIYFSQEVRFYSLLFLFSSLVLLYTLKLIKEQKLSNIILFILFSLLVIFTHTLGFIFVFFNLIFVCRVGLLSHRKKINIGGLIFLLSLIALPLLVAIFTTHAQSQFWEDFTFSKCLFLITDYFSPILINIVSAPDNFFYDFSLKFIIFALIPSGIAIAGIVKAIKGKGKREKEKEETECHCEEEQGSDEAIQKACLPAFLPSCLLFLCGAYLLTLVIAAMTGKLVFVTKYTIEIYPILIALMAFGLLEFEKKWRQGLIFTFCFLNLFYLFGYSQSAPKLHRSEGHRIVAQLIKNATLNKDDMILLTYYTPDRFEKYFDFKNYRVLSINKGNFSQYLGVNSKEDFKNYNDKIFKDKFNKEVVNQLKSGQKLAVVILDDVAVYSPDEMKKIITDEKLLKKVPYMFMAFSCLEREIIEDCPPSLRMIRLEDKGSWSVMTFEKQ